MKIATASPEDRCLKTPFSDLNSDCKTNLNCAVAPGGTVMLTGLMVMKGGIRGGSLGKGSWSLLGGFCTGTMSENNGFIFSFESRIC